MKTVHIAKILISGLTGSMLWGCVSLSSIGGSRKSGDPVVVRAGADDPVIAKLDRDSWVQIRKTEKDEEYKLYTALGTRDYQVAQQDARGYLLKHPKNRTALSVLSTSYAMQLNFDLALYYARLVQKYHGNNEGDVQNFMGLSRMHSNKPTQADFMAAIGHFESSYDGGNGQIAAGFNLAHLQLIMGNAAAAEGVFSSLKHKCDDCIDAQVGLGLAYNKQRKYERARDTFIAALKVNPNHPIALYRLALIEKNGFNNSEKAMDYLKKILADNSNDGLDIKRQASNLLNTMQAAEVGKELTAQNQKAQDKEDDDIDTAADVKIEATSAPATETNELP